MTRFLVSALVLLGALAACKETKTPAGGIICDDRRRALDCDAEVSYQGIKTEGGVSVLSLGSAQGSFADTALRQCNDKIQAYITTQTRLCREYNACIITGERYHEAAKEASDHLNGVSRLAVAAAGASDARAQIDAASKISAELGGQAPLTARLAVQATLPSSVGGGSLVLPANHPLPTNAEAAFRVELPRAANLYLFQVNSAGKVNVLFPHIAVTLHNPLPANSIVRIPQNGLAYRLDDNDLGTERVYILVSVNPLTELEKTLKRYASGEVGEVKQDPGLAELVASDHSKNCGTSTRDLKLVKEAASSSSTGCVTSRGMALAPETNSGQGAGYSLETSSVVGGDLILKVFPFLHVTEAEYPDRVKDYKASKSEGTRGRGIVIEN